MWSGCVQRDPSKSPSLQSRFFAIAFWQYKYLTFSAGPWAMGAWTACVYSGTHVRCVCMCICAHVHVFAWYRLYPPQESALTETRVTRRPVVLKVYQMCQKHQTTYSLSIISAKNTKQIAHRKCSQMADPKTVSTWHQAISSLLRTTTVSTPPPTKCPENTPQQQQQQLETDFDRKTNCGEKPILFLINPKSGSGRALNVFNSQVGNKIKLGWGYHEKSVYSLSALRRGVCTNYLHYLRTEIWKKWDNRNEDGGYLVYSAYLHCRIVLGLFLGERSILKWSARERCWNNKDVCRSG